MCHLHCPYAQDPRKGSRKWCGCDAHAAGATKKRRLGPMAATGAAIAAPSDHVELAPNPFMLDDEDVDRIAGSVAEKMRMTDGGVIQSPGKKVVPPPPPPSITVDMGAVRQLVKEELSSLRTHVDSRLDAISKQVSEMAKFHEETGWKMLMGLAAAKGFEAPVPRAATK